METLTLRQKAPHRQEIRKNSLIFVVDDHPMFLKIVKGYLSDIPNTEVRTFMSGEACLKQMHLKPLAVVIDIDLSGENKRNMNGIEVLSKIKMESPETEAIMLSSSIDENTISASREQGALDYVFKDEEALIRVKSKISTLSRKKKSQNGKKTLVIGVLTVALMAILFLSLFLSKLFT